MKTARTYAEREALLNENINLAYSWGNKLAWRFGANEARSMALEGLWKATEIYDSAKSKASFGTFASYAIRYRFQRERDHQDRVKRGRGCTHVPLDAPVHFDGAQTISEFIADQTAVRPGLSLEVEDNAAEVKRLLRSLTPRNRDVLRMYFGLNGNRVHIMDEIAAKYSVTRQRVEQIISKSLRKFYRRTRFDLQGERAA